MPLPPLRFTPSIANPTAAEVLGATTSDGAGSAWSSSSAAITFLLLAMATALL
jgi:hypothetical protein